MRREDSITRNTLIKMGVRIALLIVVSSCIAYLHVRSSLEEQALAQLEKYVAERGHRERAIFSLAESNHEILKTQVLDALTAYGDADPVAEFNARFERHADGVTRNRTEGFDGAQQPGVFVDDDLVIDADVRRRVLAFYKAVEHFGPAWHAQFEDTYITTPDNIMVIYWPEIPNWAQEAKADLYMPDEEYVWVADAEHNPTRKTVWTGLFYDHVARVWMVSCETPIYVGDRHIATIGHDITLNQLMDRTLNDVLDGASNMIFREDGRLIAAPGKSNVIKEKGGYFDIRESADARLRSTFDAVMASSNDSQRKSVIENAGNDEYIAYTEIEEPGWYLLTIFPKAVFANLALDVAKPIFLLGVASLVLEVLVLFFVLKQQIARPLQDMMGATQRIAEGDFDVRLSEDRRDEFGRLANSFNSMGKAIADRDRILANRREELEDAVKRRTQALEASNEQLEQEIGARRDIEARLRVAKLEADNASKAKSVFLANMSHEIRTPMNGVIGMASLLMDTELTLEQQELARTIHDRGDSLLTIINEILDFSKVEAGKVELEQAPFDLRRCVEDSLDLLAGRAAEQGLELLYSLPADQPTGVSGDVTRLRQILINLAGNAIKFTASGEVRIDVTCSDPTATCMRFHFAVRDTGPGIPADQIPRLFESFTQVDASTTRKYGGTGLGLVISQRLVELMDGEIWVESTVGEGTVFHFTIALPAAQDVPTSVPQAPASLEERQVLLVSGSASRREILPALLAHWGLQVTVKADPMDALDALEAGQRWDLAIMDKATDPAQTAGSLTAFMARAEHLQQERLLLTATAVTDREDPRLGTVRTLLSKPVKPVLLLHALLEAVGDNAGAASLRAPLEAAASSAAAPLPTAENASLKILLAEDNRVNQNVARKMLSRLGYSVTIVENGREAVDALVETRYDLVFMDLQMPTMDGIEATELIRRALPQEQQPRIVAMTANALMGDRERCLEAGMDDYVSKPVRLDALSAAIAATPT
ncbi:MAG: ATP-binding protein [Pseudomonadota bacterium]